MSAVQREHLAREKRLAAEPSRKNEFEDRLNVHADYVGTDYRVKRAWKEKVSEILSITAG